MAHGHDSETESDGDVSWHYFGHSKYKEHRYKHKSKRSKRSVDRDEISTEPYGFSEGGVQYGPVEPSNY